MDDIEYMTLGELIAIGRKQKRLEVEFYNLVKLTFDVKYKIDIALNGRMTYADGGQKEFESINNEGLGDKISFINQFIKNNYPESILNKIEQKYKDHKEKILAEEARISDAWEKLKDREKKLNSYISDNVDKE